AVLEVHFGRDQRQAFFASLAEKLVDFSAMKQQLPPTRRFVVLTVTVRILADMGIEEPNFVARHFSEAVFELDFAVFGGLHFSSSESKARLEAVIEDVIVPGAAIVAQDFDSRLGHCSVLALSFLYPTFVLNAGKAHCVKSLCGGCVQKAASF